MALDEQLAQQVEAELASEQPDPEREQADSLERAITNTNIAPSRDDQELKTLALDLIEFIEADDESRSEWKDRTEEYLKLAVQVAEDKSFPWPNSSNVKYPLLTTASMQFQSRCYKALLGGSRIVRARVIGNDTLGIKKDRANRISEHMSYQLLEEFPNWEEHMDTLCMVVPICGNAYKKTFYDGTNIRSELVLPQDLVVNFFSKSIEEAPRKTHVMYLNKNELVSNVRSGFYSAIDFEKLTNPEIPEDYDSLDGQGVEANEDISDPATPYKVYECHCYLDLDDDGYEEPYIVTILDQAQQIVRITPRFGPKDIEQNAEGEIVRIKPIEFFTNYRFVPDPRSGVYGLGFGHILGPINESTNTIINQLLDSGTLANMPSGWLARGARMQTGKQAFEPGEWRVINTMGDDLRKSIFPLPVKEPSKVLFELLGLFVDAGKTLASVTDMMQGKSPGQNQPFSTTSAVMEQGMAVYSTIFKRMHRAFKKELTKLYRLNKLYLPAEVYFNIIDAESGEEVPLEVQRTDYEKDTTDVVPNSDPEQVTNFQKLAEAEFLMALMQMGTVNPQETTRRVLEARGVSNIPALMEMPPPQPNPEIILKEKELAIREQEVAGDQQIEMYKAQYQAARDQAASMAKMAEAQMAGATQQLEVQKEKFNQILETAKLELERFKANLEEKKIEVDKLKAEKQEREKNTIKASQVKRPKKDAK